MLKDEVLAAVFELKGIHLYVWLDHDVDEVKVTRFPDVPRDLVEDGVGLDHGFDGATEAGE